ncbi:MAG: hypothetical protein HQL22_11715 [Candidatus Omnitrophica bacterium]|nr:hypothetical protein [Candidatus Omnitrophota bacterium]
MVYFQFLLFFVFVCSVLILGSGFHAFINTKRETIFNRCSCLGESLLLGSILVVGELMILSLLGAYKAPYLWAAVLLNFLFLLIPKARENLKTIVLQKVHLDLPLIGFILLLGLFCFRNCYYLFDVDDLLTYCYTQKLWLSAGTSLVGTSASLNSIFLPMFDAVPYSLGLSVFGQETLFPQLVNLFWRVIVVLLVFGYTSYRLNRSFGLAAAMFVVFNDHIFYSGDNPWVVINGVVPALFLAAAYNGWESRGGSSFRLILAVFFLIQVMANKYQMFYALFFVLFFILYIQSDLFRQCRDILKDRTWLIAIALSLALASLWYLKNYLITGDPVFPAFAGVHRIFDWVPQQEMVYRKFFGGVTVNQFFKYMSYFFVWPGIASAKYVIAAISFLPFVLFVVLRKESFDKKVAVELFFWMGICILILLGTCLGNHQDPRYYRYGIGVSSFTAVFIIFFFLVHVVEIKNGLLCGLIAIVLVLPNARDVIGQNSLHGPSIQDNVGVLLNKIHMDDVIRKHYPQLIAIRKDLELQKDKIDRSAWYTGLECNFPLFLLPDRPLASLWRSGLISWDSYDSADLIINNLKQRNIQWLMKYKDGHLVFVPIEEFAQEAVQYNRRPTETINNYDFPREIAQIKY